MSSELWSSNAWSSWHLFFARVLTGKYTVGKPEYLRPPPLNEKCAHLTLFDTCVDKVNEPSIFVVFNNEQCYPEFLIKYQSINKPREPSGSPAHSATFIPAPPSATVSPAYNSSISSSYSAGNLAGYTTWQGHNPIPAQPYNNPRQQSGPSASALSTTNTPSTLKPAPPSVNPQTKEKGCTVMWTLCFFST